MPRLPRAAVGRRLVPPEELAGSWGWTSPTPGFWDGGLDLVESQLDAAEQAATEARGA